MSWAKLRGQPLRRQGSQRNSRRFFALPRRVLLVVAQRDSRSRGVAAARARTITVRLTEPDSEFLHKLTLNLAFVTPAGTPGRANPASAPPGTGPYRVAAWSARRGGQLERNPRFRSGADRPAGNADRIEVALRGNARVAANIAAVERGDADLTVVANPFRSLVTRERLAALLTRAPGRLHSAPVPTTDWMFLKVTRRPFDDLRVRQAD